MDAELVAVILVAVLRHKEVRRAQAAPAMRSYWPGSLLYASRWVASGRMRQNHSWERRGRERPIGIGSKASGGGAAALWFPSTPGFATRGAPAGGQQMRRYTLKIRDREFELDVQEIDADRFEVMVGDESYDVTLSGDEELPDATITPAMLPGKTGGARPAPSPVSAAVKPPAAPAAVAVPRTPTAQRKSTGAGTGSLNAPMPGVILEVSVAVGDVVERGQPIATLEAMKMNNVIKAPRAATIAEVCVAAGQAVGHGDPIVRFKEG
jgi:biotin carboxyl carrier protein